jgi:hypothetical protein
MGIMFVICSGWGSGLSLPKSIECSPDVEAEFQNRNSRGSTNGTMIRHSSQIEQSEDVITHITKWTFVEWAFGKRRWNPMISI